MSKYFFRQRIIASLVIIGSLITYQPVAAQSSVVATEQVRIKISAGHKASKRSPRFIELVSGTPGLIVTAASGRQIEKNDKVIGAIAQLTCGQGDVDELVAEIKWIKPSAPLRKLAGHKDAYTVNNDAMWGYLMEHGSAGQSARLKNDAFYKPDAPLLTIRLSADSTEGFTVPLEQLLEHGAMWLPEQDIYLTIANKPTDFNTHLGSLKGARILDSIAKQPDASLTRFRELWPDLGDPYKWDVSWQTRYMGTRGHLTVTAAAHGSVYKFAIDRFGNARPDFASPYKFRLDLNWAGSKWKSQKIVNGLPIITTELEKDGQSVAIEQFAAPAVELSKTVRGYIPGALYTKVLVNGKAGSYSIELSFGNELKGHELEASQKEGSWIIRDKETDHIVLVVETAKSITVKANPSIQRENGQQLSLMISGSLAEGTGDEIICKLPSPSIAASELKPLLSSDYAAEKNKTIAYWESLLAQGAQFNVPEKAVNDLYRANLWHALILPRHTLDIDGKNHMDLPYANTAYGQRNADWPINQAVYVDYMIYGLRGYDKIAQEEYQAMFKSQQQADGRIGGFANWGVYSPGQLYAIAQNILLSGNQKMINELLPGALKTLDWCLAQLSKAKTGERKTGLVLAPLNDLTNAEREWAFTQAYYAGGLELFSKALALSKHPRAAEVAKAAFEFKTAVAKEFSRSSVKSPVVQLADGTWINFVPTDALTPRRMMEQWYPTDVDCGPLHLARLGVFDPNGLMTTAMLHDHEDNLFFRNLGAANEPVYVQQSTLYFLRDDAKAAIRSFYSLLACGFSHQQLTSIEHRWAWGQYYGPPSTDGAWFEIYRKLLLNEIGNDTLMIGQAIPHQWLQKDKRIEVKNAPTYFGNTSFTIDGLTEQREIKASVEAPTRRSPTMLLVRFRHPSGSPIKSVTVNGKPWKNFDVSKEYIRIPAPSGKYIITAKY